MDTPAASIPSTSPQPEVSSLSADLSAKALASAEALAKAGPAESLNRHWLLWSAIGLTFLIFGIALGFFGARFLNQSQNLSQLTPTPSLTQSQFPTPTSTTDPTANWKTFSDEMLQLSFKYPNYYEILEKNKTNVVFGAKPPDAIKPVPYLKIYLGYKTFLPLPKCSNNRNVTIRCLISENQTSLIEEIKIDNRDAKSFYIAEGVTFQIIQVSNPKLEIEMNISGGGLKWTFDQILSTFKFLDK